MFDAARPTRFKPGEGKTIRLGRMSMTIHRNPDFCKDLARNAFERRLNPRWFFAAQQASLGQTQARAWEERVAAQRAPAPGQGRPTKAHSPPKC
jgi:hypothetical protein